MSNTYSAEVFKVTFPSFVGYILASTQSSRTKCELIVIDKDGELRTNFLDGAIVVDESNARIGTIAYGICVIPCEYNKIPILKIIRNGIQCEVKMVPTKGGPIMVD